MNIKEIRNLTDLSQAKFAEMYNIPKITIEQWESGKRKPPVYMVELLEHRVREDIDKGVFEMKHKQFEVWEHNIRRHSNGEFDVIQSWLIDETDDIEEAKKIARERYEPNTDYKVEVWTNISPNYDCYDLIDFKEYDDSIFSIYDFADAEYNEDTNTCDLKFYNKAWGITAYIHNVPIPEWMKTEEDGELIYIFDDVDWQSDKAIEYALETGEKEFIKEL